MAHLEVKPKSGTPWWLWLLLAIIALAILLFLFKGCGNKPKEVATTDSTSTTTTDTTGGQQAVAATEPDWNSVDFNAPKSSDADITDKDIQVSGNDKYTIYTLGENILFATDKNEVQPGAESKLKQIVASLNKRFKGATIGVFGNADSMGTAGHNKELGTERASAVQSWLTKNGGIDASKISVHSYGEKAPVASNATAEGRKQNRNVQIVAFPNSSGQ
jgi:outer membrane protein OmpA-like peptidoglycan-associated protein